VNVSLQLWLTCLLLSASCCWRLYWLQISGVSLTLTWPLRLCLLRVLLDATTTVTSFPLSKHSGGCGTTPAFSSQRVYLQFTWEVGLPSSPVEFSSHRHFYKLSCSWLLGGCCHSCLLQPAYLQFHEGFPFPTLRRSGHPPSLLHVSFVVVVCSGFFSLSLFFPWVGLVCPESYADLAQGCLREYWMPPSSPCVLNLPKQSGSWHLAVREPSWFLHLTWSGDALCRLGVWRSQSFASSQWFFL
jgi:hypothetical protein